MHKLHLECEYCGYTWTMSYYRSSDKIECRKCGDKNVRKHKYTPIDYYAEKIKSDEE